MNTESPDVPPADRDLSVDQGAGSALCLRKITMVYRRGRSERIALDTLDLDVNRGEWIALLGPNGSGKSTLLGVASGRLRPTSGTCHVLGRPLARLERRNIGVVFQASALDPRLTVQENLSDLARLQGLDRREAEVRIHEALSRSGLADRAGDRVASLSGGLARRADLARAMLHRPRLLLLDEPITGLDPLARETCMDHLAEVHAAGDRAIIMSTHLVEEAARAQRVIMLHEGRCVADGTPEALCGEIGSRVLRIFEADFELPTDEGWTKRGRAWTRPVSGPTDPIVEDLLSQGIELSVMKPTLADVFAHRSGSVLALGEASTT